MRRILEPLLWGGVLMICGCKALSQPVVNPQTGETVKRPDGTDQTVYDQTVETGASIVSLLAGNALLAPFIVAGGAAMRGAVVNPKKEA